MWITLIATLAFLLGIGLLILSDATYSFILEVFGSLTTVFSSIAMIAALVLIICVQGTENSSYMDMVYQKQMLEYRLDHIDEDIVGNEMIYKDITFFNNELMKEKIWSSNKWTNWFWSDKCASIEYIEVEGIDWEGCEKNDTRDK